MKGWFKSAGALLKLFILGERNSIEYSIAIDADIVKKSEKGSITENVLVYLVDLEERKREELKQMYKEWVANASMVNKSLQSVA